MATKAATREYEIPERAMAESERGLRGWPLKNDLQEGGAGPEVEGGASAEGLSDAALGALLGGEAEPDADAERWVRRLAERLAQLDALNVAGMLAAATEGGGARLASRLEAGAEAGGALAARLRRLEALARAGAAPAALARGGAARADEAARALHAELQALLAWLDAPALAHLDDISEVSLSSAEGRATALGAALALQAALRAAGRAERAGGARAARLRLAAVRERLRRLARARDALAAALARHLNNALIHLANEAALEPARAGRAARAHHAHLRPYAPFMRWLKDMDEKAYDGLVKVYVGTWARAYEREVRGACEAARAQLPAAPPERADTLLDEVLTLVENICNAEQDFCAQFFCLDIDVKEETGEEGEDGAEGGEGGAEGGRRGAGDARRLMGELFPALDTELVALVGHMERHDPYGAMRALACVGRRVLGEAGEAAGSAGAVGGAGEAAGEAGEAGAAGAGEARWARAALAAVAVAAKRQADRAVAERLAALPDAVKQAARRPKCGVLSFIPELEELSAVCEGIFARTRRADLDRWYVSLVTGMCGAIAAAEHPRTPRAALRAENYHRLHGACCALRCAALEPARRDTKRRYADALRAYVTQYFGRPLDKLTQFFEGVSEVVASGVREEEVCFRAAYSKHELRRLLALYPAHEVRKSLHRLYRTVEKHLSEEGGLLQVVWRAMQEEFLAQYVQLQARIAACYPGAGLALPLSTQDILDAFSDIAREH